MPLFYAVKHVFRSWKLFLALLIGIILASTFFAGIDIKANATAKQALDQQLSGIYVDMQASLIGVTASQMQTVRETTLTVDGVADAEVIVRISWTLVKILGENKSAAYTATIVAIASESQVYNGWLNRPVGDIGEDETYVVEGSPLASQVNDGDVIQANISKLGTYDFVPLNLTVKGLASLDEKAYTIASGDQSVIIFPQGRTEFPKVSTDLFLLVSWQNTMRKIMEAGGMTDPPSLLVYLNREAVIAPWDVGTSISKIETIKNSIQNKLATELGVYNVNIQNNLQWALQMFQMQSLLIRFAFTLVSLPIFYMAWYMGTTVSDVSFNLRRREIGLLSTKGFSRGQILRVFLTETLLIGLIGGLLGVLLGALLIPLFTQFSPAAIFSPQIISPYTMIFTVAFGIAIAFLSTFSSARKASQLPTIDALREYLPVEAEKAYKKRWPWLAFILGTYKIIVFVLGINMTLELQNIIFRGGNFILAILLGTWLFIDAILNYLGPVLFFWGFTKLFIQGSLKFQELTARAARFLGDLGVLATKNVRRNPARSAAIAFLIALIVGYSVQVTGQLASEQDYAVRQIYYQVGADVAVNVGYANEAPVIRNTITENMSSQVQEATIEYSFSASTPTGAYVRIKAVEPQLWLKAAYHEDEWFSGTDAATAFNTLANDNTTIILERGVAEALNLKNGDTIALVLDHSVMNLRIIGFFGRTQSATQQPIFAPQIFSQDWSFVSTETYEDANSSISANANILVKLKGGANGKAVAEDIRNLSANISVQSFAENWEESQTNVINMGMLDVQRLGIVFAVLAASVGTALVSTVSMRERGREATIMSVKGLSYKQLVIMFLTENLAVVTFSVLLGVAVGLIVVRGNVSSLNSFSTSLIQHRMVFPLDVTLLLVSCIALIFIATFLPILIMSRKYVTKLERMVRLR